SAHARGSLQSQNDVSRLKNFRSDVKRGSESNEGAVVCRFCDYRSKPNCSLAASDIRVGFHGGSNTTSTRTSFTSGSAASLLSTSALSTLPMPHPGAVMDILISIFFPPSSVGAISQE